MTASTLIVPSARAGTCLDDRCAPLLPSAPGVHGRMCGDCGRVTTRTDAAGAARCLGEFPPFARCARCGEHLRVVSAGQTLHPSCTSEGRRRIAITRQLEQAGLPYCTCPYMAPGDCAHCKEFAARSRRKAVTR